MQRSHPPRVDSNEMAPPLLSVLVIVSVLLFAKLLHRRYRSLKHIRGPPVPSWVFGT